MSSFSSLNWNALRLRAYMLCSVLQATNKKFLKLLSDSLSCIVLGRYVLCAIIFQSISLEAIRRVVVRNSLNM